MTKARIIAALAFLLHLQACWLQYSYGANSPVIYGAPFSINLQKGMKFNQSDTTTTCNAAVAGSIRNNAGTLEACNGTAWASLNAVGGAAGVSSITLVANGLTASSTTGAITLGMLPMNLDEQNCSITASVSSATLIVTLLNAAQGTPTATAPCLITFHNETATNGLLTQVAVTSAASVTVAVGSSLGCAVGPTCAVYPYAMKVSNTVELALSSFKIYDERNAQTSTAAGTTANTIGGLYSLTSRASVPVRLLGEIQVAVNTNASWANTPTRIANLPFQPYMSDWTATTPTMTPGSGTMTNTVFSGKMRRLGNTQNIQIYGHATVSGSTGTWGRLQFNPPPNCTIDTTPLMNPNDLMPLGRAIGLVAGAADFAMVPFYSNGRYVVEAWTQNGTTAGSAIKITDLSQAVPGTWQAGDKINWFVEFPCTGW